MADNELIMVTKEIVLAATAASVQVHKNTLAYPVRLVSAAFVNAIAVTAHDTNYRTATVKKGAGGTAAVTPKTTQTSPTGTGDLAVGDSISLALLTTGGGSTDLRCLAPGEVHEVSLAHAASGVAMAGAWHLVYEPVRGV